MNACTNLRENATPRYVPRLSRSHSMRESSSASLENEQTRCQQALSATAA